MAVIKSIMKTKLQVAAPEDSVLAVSQHMAEHDQGAVLIVDKGALVGVFSERDLLKRVIAKKLDPSLISVADVMTKNPITVNETTHIKDCVQLIRNKGFRHLPVVDNQNKLTGIISTRDFLQFIVNELEALIDHAAYKERIEQDLDPYEFIGGGYLP